MFKEKYLEKLEIRAKKKGPKTAAHILADEIYDYFGKKYPFPRILRDIKFKGFQCVYETYQGIKKLDNVKNRLSLYVWKLKQIKVKFDN